MILFNNQEMEYKIRNTETNKIVHSTTDLKNHLDTYSCKYAYFYKLNKNKRCIYKYACEESKIKREKTTKEGIEKAQAWSNKIEKLLG